MASCVPDSGSRWKIFTSSEEWTKLDETRIPGLLLWKNQRGAWGEISAVAAGAKLLGEEQLPVWKERPGEVIPDAVLTQLRDYQVHGILKCKRTLNLSGIALLADDMGLGKTRQALALAGTLEGRKLIVCPAAVRLTWQEELKKLNPDAKCVVIDPYTHERLKQAREGKSRRTPVDLSAEYVITSYNLAEKIYDQAFPGDVPRILILDEAHNLRGRGRQREGNVRSKGLKAIASLIPYKLALTGTPIWDQPRDLWMLLQIIGLTSWSAWDFDVRYCAGRINQWGGMDNKGVSNAEELRLRLGYYMVRRTKQEVASELPPLTRTVEWLDAVPACTAKWQASILRPNGRTLAEALQSTHEAKLERAVELAVQAGKFLLFTYRKEHAAGLTKAVEAQGGKAVCITGDLTPQARNDLIKVAQSRGAGIVATIDSVGVGVNMQGVASYGIMHALDYLPNKMLQAEARLHRMGQALPVNWIYLAVRESADEHVVRTIVNKLDNWMAVMGRDYQSKGLRDSFDDTRDAEIEKRIMRELYETL